MPQEPKGGRCFRLLENVYELMSAEYGKEPFPGIYRLHVVAECGAFLPLPRALAKDPEGILYIGTSANVLVRIGSLRKSIFAAYKHLDYEDYGAHQTGAKMAQMPEFRKHFPLRGLCLTAERVSANPAEVEASISAHSAWEAKLLAQHRARFGENPPLNS
jgi:hypothetical protein